MAAVAEGQDNLEILFFETFFLLLDVLPLLFCTTKTERQLGGNERWQWLDSVVLPFSQ